MFSFQQCINKQWRKQIPHNTLPYQQENFLLVHVGMYRNSSKRSVTEHKQIQYNKLDLQNGNIKGAS